MPYINDIKVDADGNTVIENGDIGLTETNIEFVVRSLKYGPGSFTNNPFFGFGLDRYIGEINNEELRSRAKREITEYFNNYNIMVKVSLVTFDSLTLGGEITLPLEGVNLVFVLNLESGALTFGSEQEVTETTTNTQVTDNKYLLRR